MKFYHEWQAEAAIRKHKGLSTTTQDYRDFVAVREAEQHLIKEKE